ncbi:hypothetical protein D3C71_1516890 [compost metagenome]
MQVLGIALFHQEGLSHPIGRVRKRHLLAALGRHVHAGGDDVETLGGQAGNQGTELGQHPFHLVDAHALEHHARNFHGFTRDLGFLAVHVRKRRLVGVTDADFACRLGGFQRVGGACGRPASRSGLVAPRVGTRGQHAQAQGQQQAFGLKQGHRFSLPYLFLGAWLH